MILEVGCGNRRDPRADIAIDDFSIDFTTIGMEATKADLPMDVHNMSFPDKKFNRVIMNEVIEHLENPVQALAEINRVLEPGGVLELTTPSPYDYMRIARWILRGKTEAWKGHIWLWSEWELTMLLNKTGFKVLSVSFYNHYQSDSPLNWFFIRVLPRMCGNFKVEAQKVTDTIQKGSS